MFADSVKLKGFSCFKDGWAGFDEFKPITVIIGRNNTGKSRLLDMVRLLTGKSPENCKHEVQCNGALSEDFLKQPFDDESRSGKFSRSNYTPWHYFGQHFVGCNATWELDVNGAVTKYSIEPPDLLLQDRNRSGRLDDAYREIGRFLPHVTCSLHEKHFRCLLADRDITPEKADTNLPLAPNGNGATNIIRRYINSVDLPEKLIKDDLLSLLRRVFRSDATFEAISIHEHDESQKSDIESNFKDKWEVFLEETHKGSISLSDSGSGLKTVFLVLLNLLVIPKIDKKEVSEYVFAFEELENNLHPALLRRLLKVVTEFVERDKCYVFLTTHSNVALDFFSTRSDSQIIHVSHDGKSARTKTISTHFDHVGLLSELGSRPSDLLQANGVVWLEGPSDRIYFNRFIDLYSNGELREGRDYQCAFYGGSNLANTTFDAPEDADDTFANLLKLNNNIAVICDGDRTAKSGKGSKIKGRVSRIKREVEAIPRSFLWITKAKEVENYIPGEVWGEVFDQEEVSDPGQFDRFPASGLKPDDFVTKNLKRKSFDKMDFAMKAVPYLTKENLFPRFEFDKQMTSLIETIRLWNK